MYLWAAWKSFAFLFFHPFSNWLRLYAVKDAMHGLNKYKDNKP
jgi:hypothetical protein